MLQSEITTLPESPRRASLRRIYFYILAFLGLAATFLGLNLLFSFLIDTTIGTLSAGGASSRERLSAALATLLVGLPLWIITWRPMVVEASQDSEKGDHARRSIIRKTYLYLVLFAAVIGIMATAGNLIFELLSALLGDPSSGLLRESLVVGETLLLFVLLLIYHWSALRADSRLADHALAKQHANFPILVLAPEIGDFTESIVYALQRESTSLPVAVHPTDNGAPDENLAEAKAVILPSELVTKPPEAFRLWLQDFEGERIVIPTIDEDWYWVFGDGHDLANAAQRAAKIVRHLAEGETVPIYRDASGWKIVLYVLAGMVGLPLIFSLLTTIGSFLFD
jgi:hypothetical protein